MDGLSVFDTRRSDLLSLSLTESAAVGLLFELLLLIVLLLSLFGALEDEAWAVGECFGRMLGRDTK